MQFPSKITITDWDAFLDGGTVILYAISDDGEKYSIKLNQRMFSGFYKYPGRVFLNDELISVRSKDEHIIIELLKTASFSEDSTGIQKSRNSPVSQGSSSMNDDLSRSEWINECVHFRDEIVTFIESAEYIQIANYGLPKR